MFYWITKWIYDFLSNAGIYQGLARLLTLLIVVFGLLLAGMVFYYILKKVAHAFIRLAIRKNPLIWMETLLEKNFFGRIAALIPNLIIQKLIPQFFHAGGKAELFLSSFANICIVVNITLIITAFLKALTDVLLTKEATKDKPVKSYIQIIAVIFWAIAVILVISILLNQSPAGLLAGLGAFSAVLILVFQDTIIGFVNSIQLSSNDLLRNGDWITMSKYGVDGDVEEINLVSVKVRNFDKTVSTIPVKQLVADSFQNWRAMQDLGIRRIKRAIMVDITSIKPCTPEMLEKFKQVDVLKEYIENKEKEIEEYNSKLTTDSSLIPNRRHQTNIGVLRAYILAYLKKHQHISNDATLLVRQLEPNEYGQPLELYCFTTTAEWEKYENIQSDIFDHIFSILNFFEIRAFQRDAGKKSTKESGEL